MKITDVKVHVFEAEAVSPPSMAFLFVQVETDAGITGWGEASTWAGGASILVAHAIEAARDTLVGEDPVDIERLWRKLYRRLSYLGARGLPTHLISGIDIALWDIKGKDLGRPIYDLLGGKFRDSVPVYANAWWPVGCTAPEDFAAAAAATVEAGHKALKFDPFLELGSVSFSYVSGQIAAEDEARAVERVAAVRDAVGPHVQILIDAHGQFDVPTAIRIANRLVELDITWFEEPLPPENNQALRQVREHTRVPICVGERLFSRFDFVPIFEQRLADYVMPDVAWTGGITELKKIASMAEAYYIPISPHDREGGIQIVAGAHVALNTPNFYRLEHAVSFIPAYNGPLTEPLNFHGDLLTLSDKPGLGVEIDPAYLRARRHPAWKG